MALGGMASQVSWRYHARDAQLHFDPLGDSCDTCLAHATAPGRDGWDSNNVEAEYRMTLNRTRPFRRAPWPHSGYG